MSDPLAEDASALREYVDNMSTMNAKIAPDGTLLFVNRIALAASGLPLEELQRTKFLEGQWWSFDVGVQERVAKLFARAVAGERIQTEEIIYVFGQVMTINLSFVPVKDAKGRVRFVIAEGSDMSRVKDGDAALRESEQRFRGAFDLAPVGMAMLSLSGQFLRINRTFCDFLGYTHDELLELDYRAVTHPDDVDEDEDAIRRLLQGEIPFHRDETKYVHKEGRILWGLLNASLVRNAEGSPLYFIAQVLDITARRRAEEEIRRRSETERIIKDVADASNRARSSGEAYRFALATLCAHTGWPVGHVFAVEDGPDRALIPTGIWHFDEPRRFEEFARRTMEMRSQIEGHVVSDLMATGKPVWIDNLDGAESFLRRQAAAEAGLASGFFFPVLADREIVAVCEFFSPETAAPDEAIVDLASQIGTQLGRTVERERAQESIRTLNAELEQRVSERTADLLRSNEELQQFAYVASHDLQEPIRIVASYTDLVSKRYADRIDEEGREFLGFAKDGVLRMQRLIKDLLAYSRVEIVPETFVPTSSERALEQALENLGIVIEESGAVISRRGELPTVFADPIQLVQLFQNLLSNAIKFRRDEPPRIEVWAERDAKHWTFSIQDNGIGIPHQHLERIFVIFQRLHPRERYPGTGIGLAICKKIVGRHGGLIAVESVPGSGTLFRFTLPIQSRRGR